MRIIFVSDGIAKVDEEAITQILCNPPLILLNALGAHCLVGLHDLTPLFGIESSGECGGIDEVAEEHGQLPPFGGSV